MSASVVDFSIREDYTILHFSLCTLDFGLSQRRRFELLDLSYHLLNVAKHEANSDTQKDNALIGSVDKALQVRSARNVHQSWNTFKCEQRFRWLKWRFNITRLSHCTVSIGRR